MKRISLIFVAVLFCSVLAFGQDATANYAGTWNLDVSKSEMGERGRVKSMTMTVTQTAEALSYERTVIREEPPAGGGRPGGGGGGGMGGGGGRGPGGGMGGNQKATFTLDGKETKSDGEMGSVKLQAKNEKGMLKLTQKRSIDTQMGPMNINSTEKWSLSEDGKTLTIASETSTPRGNTNTKMIFTQKTE